MALRTTKAKKVGKKKVSATKAKASTTKPPAKKVAPKKAKAKKVSQKIKPPVRKKVPVKKIPEVESLLPTRAKPKVFASKLSELFSKYASHPVKVTYIPGVERYSEIEGKKRMPWVRILETDGGGGGVDYLTLIHFSQSFVANPKLCRRGVVGLLDRFRKGK